MPPKKQSKLSRSAKRVKGWKNPETGEIQKSTLIKRKKPVRKPKSLPVETAVTNADIDTSTEFTTDKIQPTSNSPDVVTQAELDEIAQAFKEDELLWGMVYCKHYFRKKSPEFHLEILEQQRLYRELACQAPRGSAKSTILAMLLPTHGICYKKYRFIVIVQNTFKKSAASLENIKTEFRDNVKVKSYGVGFIKDAEGDTIFAHPDGYKIRVICKGADQLGSIRGERFGAYRPDMVIIDDLEDDELVKNPERRQSLEAQFNEVLKYAGDLGVTKTVIVGTILHDDSLMAKLVSRTKYKNFRKLVYKARYDINGEKQSLWPDKWSVEDLNQMEKEDPEGFAKEMQGDPSSGDLETIRRSDFRYWEVRNGKVALLNADGSVASLWDWKDLKPAIALDLAWEDKKVSDFSVVVPGFCTPHNDILIESYVAKRGMRPDELESILFDMSLRMERLTGRRVQVGMEKAKLEKVMKWFLSEAQRRRNQWLWMKDISWGTKDKVERVLSRLGNRYAQHSVYHRTGMGDLENQLIRIRSVAHDDIADAVSMLPEMLAYAPGVKKAVQGEDMFKFLQKQTTGYREKNKSKFVFGQGNRPTPFKVVQGI